MKLRGKSKVEDKGGIGGEAMGVDLTKSHNMHVCNPQTIKIKIKIIKKIKGLKIVEVITLFRIIHISTDTEKATTIKLLRYVVQVTQASSSQIRKLLNAQIVG